MTTDTQLPCPAIVLVVLSLLFAVFLSRGVAQAPAQLVVRNAYIFSMAPEQRTPFRGYLVVGEDGRLTAG